MLGSTGSDTFSGGLGDDSLFGESGDDVYIFEYSGNLGSDWISEAGNVESDTLDFTDLGKAATVNLSTTGNQTVNSGSLVVNLISTVSGTGIENVRGSTFADSITGKSRAT